MRSVADSVWAPESSVWAVVSSVSDVEASACCAQALHGMLHPLYMEHMVYMGCCSLCVGYCSLCVGCCILYACYAGITQDFAGTTWAVSACAPAAQAPRRVLKPLCGLVGAPCKMMQTLSRQEIKTWN